MCCPPSLDTDSGALTSLEGLEIADVFRQFRAELPPLPPHLERTVSDIIKCRTVALGGHLQECDECGHLEPFLNSCMNRHCPKCQSLKQARWLEAREADLLPVEYFHVVFTIPHELHPLFRTNQAACYRLLFAAVAETLKEVALNPKNLGAKIGLIAVLHTWTQTLLYHPHLHCIVPGGGLNADGTEWLPCRSGYLLPVRVLSEVFRAKLLSKLEKAVKKGKVRLAEDASTMLKKAARKRWNVYSKPPFGGPAHVLKYLGRYTHRIAISSSRLVAMDDQQVTFRYKDRANQNVGKTLTLDGAEFLRRFLLHVVPKGFMRIRYYGFLANCVREASIALCRKLLGVKDLDDSTGQTDEPAETWAQLTERLTGEDPTLCPVCKVGHLVRTLTFEPGESPWSLPSSTPWSLPGRATSP